MDKRLLASAAVLILAGCSGADEGPDEASEAKAAFVGACGALEQPAELCECMGTSFSEHLRPELVQSAATAIREGKSPSQWKRSLSQEDKILAEEADNASEAACL